MIGGQGNLDAWGIGMGVFFEEGVQGFGFERVKIGIVGFFNRKGAKVYAKNAMVFSLIIRLFDFWIIGFLTANPEASGTKVYAKDAMVFSLMIRLFDFWIIGLLNRKRYTPSPQRFF